jgi:hypothetical protein
MSERLRDLAGKRLSLSIRFLPPAAAQIKCPDKELALSLTTRPARHASADLSIPNLVYSSTVFSSIAGQKWATTSSVVVFDLESV